MRLASFSVFVMAGLDPAIHDALFRLSEGVDARVKPGHDGASAWRYPSLNPVAASSSAIAWAPLSTLIVVMPMARAGFRLMPRSSR
jgi:hypothetical protein